MPSIQQLLKQACEDHGDVSFRNTYSGRGMYGRQCVGITGDPGEVSRVVSQVIKDARLADVKDDDFDFDLLVDTLLVEYNEDSMGLGTIMYWPCLEPLDEENLEISLHDADLNEDPV